MVVEKMQIIVLCVGSSFMCMEHLISISSLLMKSSSVQIFLQKGTDATHKE